MSTKKHQLTERLTRPGEGVAIDVVQHRSDAGSVGQTISINLSSATVPDRRYPADVAAVIVDSDMVRLLFGQRKVLGKGLESLVIIQLPFIGARNFLRSMAEVAEKATAYVAKHHVADPPELDREATPNQTVTLTANFIAAAFTAREACIDFYHVSSFAFRGIGAGGKLYADPVVRVTLIARLLLAIHDDLESQKDAMPVDELEGKL